MKSVVQIGLQTFFVEEKFLDTQGLTIIHTGDGKGKSTAAFGLAIRAYGAGLNVLILQFIKGRQISGELNALNLLTKIPAENKIEVRQCGLGFIDKNKIDEHIAAAESALEVARAEILSGKWNLIILDEVIYSVKFNLIDVKKVLELIKIRPSELHLVLTGRDAPQILIDAADLVTEMKLIKHPFQRGVKAQRGIEF